MAIALALTASLCWGVGDFLGGSLSRRHPLLVVVLISQLVGLVGIATVAALRTGAPPAGVVAPGALAGVMGVIGILSFYRAMTIGAIAAQLSGQIIAGASNAMPMLLLMLFFGCATAAAVFALVRRQQTSLA